MKSTHCPLLFAAILFTGCASNKNMVFFTNTSIGVEVAVEPSGTTPGKFILGYKRQEGVIDPVHSQSESDPTTKKKSDKMRDEAHSVLAKLNFGTKAEKIASAEAAQWFATGEAARIMAKAPAIAGAVTGSAEIARAAAQAAFTFKGQDQLSEIAELRNIFKKIKKDAAAEKKEAREIVAGLNSAAQAFEGAAFTKFVPSGSADLKKVAAAPIAITDFDKLLDYWDALNTTHATLAEALKKNVSQLTVEDAIGNAQPITDAEKNQARESFEFSKNRLEVLTQAFSSHPRLVAALDYYSKSLFVQNKQP